MQTFRFEKSVKSNHRIIELFVPYIYICCTVFASPLCSFLSGRMRHDTHDTVYQSSMYVKSGQ